MPFIVSLFKYLILGVCFLTIMGLALFVFAAVDPNGPLHEAAPYAIAGALAAVVFMIVNLGAISILISIHDRHEEIAEVVLGLAEANERHEA